MGSQSVEYKSIDGWETPTSAIVVINAGEVSSATGTYIAQEMIYVDHVDATCGGMNPCFQSIQSALSVHGEAKLIKVRGGIYNEEINLNQSQFVTIRAGYEAGFLSVGSISSVKKITVTSGRLALENMVLMGSAASATAAESNEAASPSYSLVTSASARRSEEVILGHHRAGAMPCTIEDYLLRSRNFKHSGNRLSDSESWFLRDFITNLYRESLGREPQEWALDLWKLYISYLIDSLGIKMKQALWDAGVKVFDSEKYK